MQRFIRVVRLTNGNYLKDYDYSQGMESHVETYDVLEALNFLTRSSNIDFALKLYKGSTAETYKVQLELVGD